MRCFDPKKIRTRHKRTHPIIGHAAYHGKMTIYNICKTMYDNKFVCPEDERMRIDLLFERKQRNWTIKDV